MKIVIDTYAWIEFFIGSEKGFKVKEILEDADEVYTPDTVLAEVARKYTREGADVKTVAARLETITATSRVMPIDATVALEAAKCYLELAEHAQKAKQSQPSLFDAIVLATGRVLKSKIVTGDEHFRDMPEIVWIA
ncbi:MAG: PIN domain-containing protein [Candidatus Bathyarchaeales archaeon]